MTEDIRFMLDSQPKEFQVRIWAVLGYDSTVDSEVIALIAAAQVGETEKVRKLLQAGANVNATGTYGSTALMRAAGGGHIEFVL